MKATWILSIAAGAAGLLCAGALLFDAPALSGRANAAALRAEPVPEEAGRAEPAELWRALEELALRVERLELEAAAPAAERVSAPALSAAELERLRALLAAIGPAGAEPGGLGDSAPLAEFVEAVIDERERRERDSQSEARRAAAVERVERRVAELAAELGLSSYQSAEMLVVLTDEELGREAFFDELRETSAFDRDLVRSRLRDLRYTTLAAARELLAPDQYARYAASRPDDFLSGRSPRPDDGGATR